MYISDFRVTYKQKLFIHDSSMYNIEKSKLQNVVKSKNRQTLKTKKILRKAVHFLIYVGNVFDVMKCFCSAWFN